MFWIKQNSYNIQYDGQWSQQNSARSGGRTDWSFAFVVTSFVLLQFEVTVAFAVNLAGVTNRRLFHVISKLFLLIWRQRKTFFFTMLNLKSQGLEKYPRPPVVLFHRAAQWMKKKIRIFNKFRFSFLVSWAKARQGLSYISTNMTIQPIFLVNSKWSNKIFFLTQNV